MTDNLKPGQRAGKHMLIISWVLALAGLTLYFSHREERQYNPNQNPEAAATSKGKEVRLKRNRYGHYVATGAINGKPVTFMLDTGASHVAIPAKLERALGLSKGVQFPVTTANGTIDVWATKIDSLELGPIRLYDVRASLNPGMNDDEVLLGMSVLKTLDFSQSGDVLTLKQYTGSSQKN